MPITSKDIALKLKQRVNKKDTMDFDSIPKNEIVEAYNKAEMNVVNYLYQPKDQLRQGFEATRRRVDDLEILINTDPLQLSVTRKDGYYITEPLPSNYLHYIRSETLAKTKDCDKKLLRNHQVEESNINTLLRDENLKPSFLWAETLITLAGDKMKVYTNNEFDVLNVKFTYLNRPPGIDLAGYIKQDGSPSTYIDPILKDEVVEMCIDEAARIIQGDIQNQFGMQVAQQNVTAVL